MLLTKGSFHIRESKHLPEVPSALVMERDGLHLKEMNLLLLKKVEEMTLHLINQNKKIEALEDVIQCLTERVGALDQELIENK